MAQKVSFGSLTADSQVVSRASLCEIRNRESGSVTGYLRVSNSALERHCHPNRCSIVTFILMLILSIGKAAKL